MWKKIRIVILLLVLATVAQQSWRDQASLDWKDNFYVAVYPINADGSAKVAAYIHKLNQEDFAPMGDYFTEEAARYGVMLRRPIEIQLGSQVHDLPPAPNVHGSMLDTIIWSLKFRYYAWNNSPKVAIKPDIRLYLLYCDPVTHRSLKESTALSKGRLGRINLFGATEYNDQNLVITAHELLHTFGATDKYDLSNNLPLFPDGYAERDKLPLHPQSFAEIMGGRLPISEVKAVIPQNLAQTLVGSKTAREIGWVK
ncbi:MAG: hypothetical protein H7Z18_02785 [Methylophilaceae bacterium]|nr:hypothetical protein [Methylophilaceae bacterium]